MSGKPDGKYRKTKKNGPVRKQAAAKTKRESNLRKGLIEELRLTIARGKR